PVVARTPSRLSRGKCFNSTVVGVCPNAHPLIASPIMSARRLFFMFPLPKLTVSGCQSLAEMTGAYFLGRRQSRNRFPPPLSTRRSGSLPSSRRYIRATSKDRQFLIFSRIAKYLLTDIQPYG